MGCATLPENESQAIYLLGSELQYSLDEKAWQEKYGPPRAREEDKEYKDFPYKKAEKEKHTSD